MLDSCTEKGLKVEICVYVCAGFFCLSVFSHLKREPGPNCQ